MRILVRSLRLLALTVWLGGLVFFAFVVAPTVFSPMVTERTHSMVVSGAIVGSVLQQLHWIGIVCGMVFAVCVVGMQRRRAKAELITVAAMLLLTAVSQFGILPQMERDRVQAGGDIGDASDDNPARVDFEKLHPLSEKMEGLVLLGGLALVVLMASEASGRAHTIE